MGRYPAQITQKNLPITTRFQPGDTMQLTNQSTMSRHFAALTVSLALITAPAIAQVCPFDDGNSSLEVEGLILTRYALGVTGAPLVASTGINAVDAPSVEATINCPSCGLNITGNATLTVADATIISRKLAGFSGTALTNGVALGSGTRNTAAAVQSFLLAGCGASGGTVTSIATGAGLTGGTITTTGTINLTSTQLLPTTACSTDQIAKWNGSAWVCTTPPPTLQSQLTSCIIGQALALGPNGTIACSTLPNQVNSLFTTAISIADISMVVQADGLPFIFYYNVTNSGLYGVKCSNAACTGSQSVNPFDTAGVVGSGNSSAVGADNIPVVSYYDSTNTNLKVAKLLSVNSTGATTTTVDSAGSVGFVSAIAVPADGLPVIAYLDFTNTALKVAKCGNAACSNLNVLTTVEAGANVGVTTGMAIAISADGLPIIAYSNGSGLTRVVKCGNASCSSGNTFTTITAGGQFVGAERLSIAVSPADGLPVIAGYSSLGGSGIQVSKCGNPSCSSGNAIAFFINNADSQSVKVGLDNLPVMSYRDLSAGGSLRVLKCGSANCATGNTITTLDSPGVGTFTALVLPPDGKPVISYYDYTNSKIKVVKCSNAACLNP
jgi:hypothetical protein